jgi:phosphatidylserine/phosphatidylglycerophosphate/cardiolipin synthase-like enzyme
MSDPIAQLGQLLTGSEAAKLAARYSDGDTLSQALQGVAIGRRSDVRAALEAASVVPDNLALALPVLRAIHGAATARTTDVSPIWTLPGYLVDYGALTTSIKDLVLTARQSVTCSTFNFQKSSALWTALREVAARGTVEVLVYLDTHAADEGKWAGSPTSAEVASQLFGAHVYRTRRVDGQLVRNHAKFVAVDHQFLVVTSANFSVSAEQHNIELGLRVDSRALAERVEQQLFDAQTTLYERVKE